MKPVGTIKYRDVAYEALEDIKKGDAVFIQQESMVSCGVCQFWSQFSEIESNGICRRYPPARRPGAGMGPAFPETQRKQWCGEFKEKSK